MALKGLKVVEMAGLAPVPLAGMILADFGASVVRVDKLNQPPLDTLARSKRSIAVSLKHPLGVDIVHKLCCQADVLIEPYRPGVMEKLGLSPESLLRDNPRLVYARLTGFGQSGPLANRAGHDINYLATAGVLSMLGRENEKPLPPINLLGDFAGGSLTCVMGIVMALFERTRSNKGQVVDTAMVDGAAYLSSFLVTSRKIGFFTGERGTNLLDSGAPFYDTYRTSDGKFMSVGAIEPQFYMALLKGLDLHNDDLPGQMDQTQWEHMKETFAAIFVSKTQKQWTEIFKEMDACVEPVLEIDEACNHPHNIHRGVFHKDPSGAIDIMPAPKLERTPAKPESFNQPEIGEHTLQILKELNYTDEVISDLARDNVIYQCDRNAKL